MPTLTTKVAKSTNTKGNINTNKESFLFLVMNQLETTKNDQIFRDKLNALFSLLPLESKYLIEIEEYLVSCKGMTIKEKDKVYIQLKTKWSNYWVKIEKISKVEEKYLIKYYPKFTYSQQQKINKITNINKLLPNLKNILVNKKENILSKYFKEIKNNDYTGLQNFLNMPNTVIKTREGEKIITSLILNENSTKKQHSFDELNNIFMSVLEKCVHLTGYFYNETPLRHILHASPEIFSQHLNNLKTANLQNSKYSSEKIKYNIHKYLTQLDFMDSSPRQFLSYMLVGAATSAIYYESEACMSSVKQFENFFINMNTIFQMYPEKFKKLYKSIKKPIDSNSNLLEDVFPSINKKDIDKELNYGIWHKNTEKIKSNILEFSEIIYSKQKLNRIIKPNSIENKNSNPAVVSSLNNKYKI